MGILIFVPFNDAKAILQQCIPRFFYFWSVRFIAGTDNVMCAYLGGWDFTTNPNEVEYTCIMIIRVTCIQNIVKTS